jgi:glycosyltransferase involved in cell wall biosynthesis
MKTTGGLPTVKLVVDDRWLHSGGIGRYSNEILKRLPSMGVEISYLGAKFPIKDPLSPIKLGTMLRKVSADVFWSPGFMPAAFPGIPSVITIHDLIHLSFGSRAQILYYNQIIKPLALKAQFIITVSEYSKTEISAWLNCPDEKIVAIPHGLDSTFCSEGDKFSIGRPYLLYVGNYRIYKNLNRLIEGYARSGVSKDYDLVFTGPFDDNLNSVATACGVSDRIKFLGGVEESRIASVYRGSSGLIFISLMEGFGLPAIEAMGCGVPVLCSKTSGLGEITGDAALKICPTSIQQIADGIKILVSDTNIRQILNSKGYEQSRIFSWDNSARSTYNVLLASING